ncbi:hypothetical protein SAMN05443665_104141 [Actinomadura meyerae]|uniref:Uncharacterized protein n=1 Tax=Actinomadura meyerae TaxID=240840 RepID=A0A239NGY0_9ACTN|nr:hypothetical protein [Actinomadura meyerae]SNT54125.1 hypothetical protein SAMN05443665_104141 [Actinomadura meyerae]
MTGFLIVAGILLVLGWAVFTQVAGRQQVEVLTALPPEEARRVVHESFGKIWRRTDGLGVDNFRPLLRLHSPTISVDYEPLDGGGCAVQIWVSQFTTQAGFIRLHAQLCWRKKRYVARRILRSEGVLTQAA